ncbi:RCC1 domain-containing protein [Bifidobacterium asteroides]|uniref:Regulator of chromosome condensation, RCC1 n=1 Tax=Bifidobacterium asteroides TaxID=1684 RepID=A0A2N3RBY5_9BIFI|nr:InlB B-repeat-containing protein [Bifidobacterium asteroides]PKV10010.1 regulator of chromosome condensation, RCC1 [Bifidobacterium asteroides]
MHLVSRLRRTLAMTIILLGMLAGLGVASAQADAPVLTGGGGRQTPRVAEQTPGISPSSTPETPLPSPSPIQAATPLSPTASPGTPSSTTGAPGSTGSAQAKPAENTDGQASHIVRFDPADGSKPTQTSVKTGTLAAAPQQNPQREGFRFDGWTLDSQPFDLQTPILQDTTLKAQWSKTTDWTLSPDHGPATGGKLTISPPDSKEPGFSSIHAAGDQTVGLTGDGRIHTWTQESTPKQVPSPAQAPDGFRYLQVAAGSRRQAALGSDQRIYTWNSGQPTPAILDTGKDARFTSISMDNDLLLAVDRQGRVHAFRTSQADSQGLNPKFLEQAAASLPGQAQAVTAAASASQALIVDADGLAWTWEMSNLGKAKPARVKQDPGMRIVQAQALNQGFLLLDTNGQARYLPDGKSSPTIVSLPDGEQTGTINSSGDQATIIDKHGHVWAWQPGETPKRADNGNQLYVQAASTGGGIAAISRQGSLYRWSLDTQGQPGKPDRLDTAQAPTLASASLDGQPINLTAKNDAWQAGMPARKPGQAAILITGRQDGQPFARSLAYTVDQPLARGAEPGSAFTVRFDTGGGNPKPADQTVPSPYGRAKRPSPDPVREGFLFDGWFTGDVAYDFSRPVDKDLTLAAHWTPAGRNTRWSISPDKGSQLGREPATITPPDSASRGIRFSQVSGGKDPSYGFSLAVGSDGNAWAWGYNYNGRLGDGTRDDKHAPVMVLTPDRKTYPDLPADFTYLQVSAGTYHSLAVGSDGNVYAWGHNGNGQLGIGTGSGQSTPVRVKTPDRKTYPDLPADFTYLQVSAGWGHSLAVGSDGNVYAWGYNSQGQLGDGTSTERHAPVRVRTPDRSTYPDLPADFTYLQVSAGYLHSLAVGSDGNVYAWGYNDHGQLGNGTTSYSGQSTPVRVKTPDRKTYPDLPADFTYLQVSAGWGYSLALGSDGNAYAWGANGYGALGDGTGSSQSAPVRVKTPDRKTYPDLPADFTYLQVSAGYLHSLAVGSDGYAYAWGNNGYGQLGNNSSGNYANSSVPVRVRDPASPGDASKGLQATQVSAGYHHSLAVGSDGNAWAWGRNSSGQLGDNSTDSKSVPVPVSFNLTPVITGVRFDQTPVSGLTRGDGSSVTVTTPAHLPGTVTVSVDYTLGGAPQTPDTSLRYTYLPAGVLPQAGGEGILLALATGMTGMGGVLASRRHRQETRQLSHASHE